MHDRSSRPTRQPRNQIPLPGFDDSQRIERRLDAAVEVEHVVAELGPQPRPLERPDAVLAGDRAAEGQRQRPSPRRRPASARATASAIVAVEGDQRVEVAVAGVADDGDGRVAGGRPPAATPATRSGIRGTGTPTSSMSTVPSASTAGMAIRRAAMSCSPSSSSVGGRHVVGARRSQARSMTATSAAGLAAAGVGPAQQKRPAVGSRPMCIRASTARIEHRSISSSAAGRQPADDRRSRRGRRRRRRRRWRPWSWTRGRQRPQPQAWPR